MPKTVVTKTHIFEYPVRRGKVRDVYDLGQELLIAATNRISAFDFVLPEPPFTRPQKRRKAMTYPNKHSGEDSGSSISGGAVKCKY